MAERRLWGEALTFVQINRMAGTGRKPLIDDRPLPFDLERSSVNRPLVYWSHRQYTLSDIR